MVQVYYTVEKHLLAIFAFVFPVIHFSWQFNAFPPHENVNRGIEIIFSIQIVTKRINPPSCHNKTLVTGVRFSKQNVCALCSHILDLILNTDEFEEWPFPINYVFITFFSLLCITFL